MPEIYDFENLYNAWENARKGKRYRGEVLRFSNNLESNLIEIQNHLIYESYEIGRYREFYIYEPKKRLIMALPFYDRVVQWAIYLKLFPLLEKQFIFNSYACRKGKGAHSAADKLQSWLRLVDRKPEKYYYLKLDVAKYFYRIDHDVLIKILRKKIKDEKLIRLLSKIINSEDKKFGIPLGTDLDAVQPDYRLDDTGIPIGNLTSQMFANLYLNELDQFVKHELKQHYYIRYMDDIIILNSDKKELGRIKDIIENYLNDNLRLNLNNKTAIRPCYLGVEFVGFRIWSTHRKLKKQTSKKIERRIKHLTRMLCQGQISKETFDRSVASYKGVTKHFNSYGFKKKLNKIYKDIKKEEKANGREFNDNDNYTKHN